MTKNVFLLILFGSTLLGCTPKVSVSSNSAISKNYECFEENSESEVFIVIEEDPVFQNGLEDLAEYVDVNLDNSTIEGIENGEVQMNVIILSTGMPCLSEIQGPLDNADLITNFEELIADMPLWVPGKQGGIERNTNIVITISIQNAIISNVTSIVGR